MPDLERQLPSRLESVPAARHAFRLAAARLPGPVQAELELLVSELVANSVRHGSPSEEDEVTLRVKVADSRVRIEVEDGGPGFEMREPRPLAARTSGWGLYFLDHLSDRWGVDRDAGTTVWCERDLNDGSRATA